MCVICVAGWAITQVEKIFALTVLLFVMVQYFSVSEVVAPVVTLVITIPLNFLMNKFWAFK